MLLRMWAETVTAELPGRLVEAGAGIEFGTLEAAARDELMRLWDDLNWARIRAARGCWSGLCESLTRRIVVLTRHVGATDWTDIQAPLIRSGLYERIHREAGLEHPPIDWERFDAYERKRAGEQVKAQLRRGERAVCEPTGELLTAAEHHAMDLTVELVNLVCRDIVGHGRTRTGDINELVGDVHAVQRTILKQAAARAYPDRYRLLGGEIDTLETTT
jgi:hypothetical protein